MLIGPSPRAWGLRAYDDLKDGAVRSIPTCVGFTSCFILTASSTSVHPHVRGVYNSSKRFIEPVSGPSPRAWGLHGLNVRRAILGRSIPTCVGFTPARPFPKLSAPVHPHVRGVYTEIKSKISRVSIKTALLPAEKFKILFLVKIKGSAAAFLDHTIFRDQSPPGLHFEIALHL